MHNCHIRQFLPDFSQKNVYVSHKLAEIFNLWRNSAYPDISHTFCLARFIFKKYRLTHLLVKCCQYTHTRTHTHTHTFNGPLSGTTQVSQYQKGKTNLDVTEARDSEWQWHQVGDTQICTSIQTNNHASTPPLSFYRHGCPSCRPTNSVKALKANCQYTYF